MNTQEQAYINGFVKRASEYGINYNDAIELLKQASALTRAIHSKKVSPYAMARYFDSFGPRDGDRLVQAIQQNPHGFNRHPDVKTLDSMRAEVDRIRDAIRKINPAERKSDLARLKDSERKYNLTNKRDLLLDKVMHLKHDPGVAQAPGIPNARANLEAIRRKQQNILKLDAPTDVQQEIMRIQGNPGEKIRSDLRPLKRDYHTGERLKVPYNNPEQPLALRPGGTQLP